MAVSLKVSELGALGQEVSMEELEQLRKNMAAAGSKKKERYQTRFSAAKFLRKFGHNFPTPRFWGVQLMADVDF